MIYEDFLIEWNLLFQLITHDIFHLLVFKNNNYKLCVLRIFVYTKKNKKKRYTKVKKEESGSLFYIYIFDKMMYWDICVWLLGTTKVIRTQ